MSLEEYHLVLGSQSFAVAAFFLRWEFSSVSLLVRDYLKRFSMTKYFLLLLKRLLDSYRISQSAHAPSNKYNHNV